MKFLAGYVMRGPTQAILVTSVSAMLSLVLFLPPLSYLSGAAVGLAGLRLGVRKGLLVASGAAVAVALLSLVVLQTPLLGPAFLVVLWLPVVALAAHLRRTVSLERTLALAAVCGGALVVALHLGVEDPAAFWKSAFEGFPGNRPVAAIEEVFRFMTGFMAAAFTLSLLGSLFIARWWQALLYNPGGFQSEFHALRFRRGFGLLTLGTSVLAVAGSGILGAMAGNLLLVYLVLHLVHGFAVAHGVVRQAGVSPGWLVVLYVLLVMPPPMSPAVVVVLAAVGLVDEWFDFRSFFGKKNEEV